MMIGRFYIPRQEFDYEGWFSNVFTLADDFEGVSAQQMIGKLPELSN